MPPGWLGRGGREDIWARPDRVGRGIFCLRKLEKSMLQGWQKDKELMLVVLLFDRPPICFNGIGSICNVCLFSGSSLVWNERVSLARPLLWRSMVEIWLVDMAFIRSGALQFLGADRDTSWEIREPRCGSNIGQKFHVLLTTCGNLIPTWIFL